MLFFPTSSLWRADVRTAPLDPNSKAFVAHLAAVPASSKTINFDHYTVPIYTVPASQPTLRVQVGQKVGTSKATAANIAALQAAWEHVPLPRNAVGSLGNDRNMAVVRGKEVWEFFGFQWQADGTAKAGWGDYIADYTTHSGIFTAESHWGSTAPGFASLGGLVTLADCAAGVVDHALGMELPSRKGWLSKPALRTDGQSEEPLALPEGARLRLDPAFNIAGANLPPFTAMLARAAQKYGIVVKDRSSAYVFIVEDATHLGAPNPYTKPGGYFGGKGAPSLMAAFPWSHLQLLKMELVKYP